MNVAYELLRILTDGAKTPNRQFATVHVPRVRFLTTEYAFVRLSITAFIDYEEIQKRI